MKYKIITIKEDKGVLKLNDYEVARLMNCSPSYVNHLRKGNRVATEAFYLKLKKIMDKMLTS